MATQEELEARLARAEVALTDAVVNAVAAKGDRSEADARLESARASCRQARAALLEFHRAKALPGTHQSGFILSGDSPALSAAPASVSAPAKLPAAAAAPRARAARRPRPSQRPRDRGPGWLSAARAFVSGKLRANPMLQRQAVGFLALVLAYLYYYYMEVQFEILRLSLMAVSLLQ
jgi:hypothetical protein